MTLERVDPPLKKGGDHTMCVMFPPIDLDILKSSITSWYYSMAAIIFFKERYKSFSLKVVNWLRSIVLRVVDIFFSVKLMVNGPFPEDIVSRCCKRDFSLVIWLSLLTRESLCTLQLH